MSYILDALRKAEAERERGNVPNLHAQPAFAGARPSTAPAKSRAWLVVLVLAALLMLAAALVGYLLWGRGPANDAALATARPNAPVALAPPAAAPTTPPAAMPGTATPAPVAQAPVATAAPAATSRTLAPMPTTPAPATPTAAAPAAATAATVRKPRTASAEPAAAATSLPAPAVASAAAAEERVYAMAELPDNIRQQLPALSVGGSMYSSSAASRLVIINGQVLHEGERITPDLTVQQIKQKSAVLSTKGYRFTLPF
jgi:general secretion pathway protein B